MEMMKSSKAIAVVTTALFMVSLFWLLNTKRINSSLETGLQSEKLKSESLLSEKLFLERDIQKMKDQLFTIKGENVQLNQVLESASEKLKAQEAEYNRMKKNNASLTQIRKQRQELLALQSQLENELQSLRASYTELEAKNNDLNNTLAFLQERNQMLTDDLNRAMFAAVDHSHVQALKGKKERLTVRARKTSKLIANFEVPGNLKKLSFRVIDPQGNALSAKDGTITSTTSPSDESYTASTDSEAEGKKLQKVEMVYAAKAKLKSGLYTVEILNENLYVGSLNVKLR
jgi:uncharacterized protein YhaN